MNGAGVAASTANIPRPTLPAERLVADMCRLELFDNIGASDTVPDITNFHILFTHKAVAREEPTVGGNCQITFTSTALGHASGTAPGLIEHYPEMKERKGIPFLQTSKICPRESVALRFQLGEILLLDSNFSVFA
jgi:hypothetical protein